MSRTHALFDVVGPRARRRIRVITALSFVGIVALIVLALWRFAQAGQLAGNRWVEFSQWPYLNFLLVGLLNTLNAAAIAALIAIPLGVIFALGRLSRVRPIRWLSVAYIEFFRSVPLLLIIYMFVFALPEYGVNPSVYWKLVIPIGLCSSAVLAEIFRAGIQAVPSGQKEAGLAIGLTDRAAMLLVVLPQGVRIVIPALVAQLVVVVKDTALGFVVSFPELMKSGNNLTAYTNHLIQTYLVIVVIYVVMNMLIAQFARWLEMRMSSKVRTTTGWTAMRGLKVVSAGG